MDFLKQVNLLLLFRIFTLWTFKSLTGILHITDEHPETLHLRDYWPFWFELLRGSEE